MGVESVYQLKCSCNQYSWGHKGSVSLPARLCEKTPGYDSQDPRKDFAIEESSPYSEMWMGTYPELPSYVIPSGEDLQHILDEYSDELLGTQTIDKFGHATLPFLPKILSIAKALPLQIHPDVDLASKLHDENPSDFTDPNHKPEIAIALTDFEAFCGFRPLNEIDQILRLEPLNKFRQQVNGEQFNNDSLREVVRAMLTADDKTISTTCAELRKLEYSAFGSASYIEFLLPRLIDQYTDTDPGIVVALTTMNYLTLEPGQCIYIPTDGIHAYLSGDIIECMARSNNTLNTGFCPKADRSSVHVFCSALTFSPQATQDCLVESVAYEGGKEGKTRAYKPPLSEFDMFVTTLSGVGNGGDNTIERELLQAVRGPSIMCALQGEGKLKAKGGEWDIRQGFVFFVGRGTEVELESTDGLCVATAYVE